MKIVLPALFCALLSACATTTQTVGPDVARKVTKSNPSRYPKLRSAMPQMPCQKPTWPKEAIRKELTGTVTMKFLIDVDGRVLQKEIVESSGHEMLDSAALEATARCKLTVAPMKGSLEQEWVLNQYVWTLD